MVRAGEDPGFIFRRMIVSAGEDVGMADPNAIVAVQACAAAFDRVGFPEGNFQLAQAALYLATAPKSNSVLAFFDAMDAVEKEDAEIPNHLRDGNRDAQGFGHGEGYLYPHAYREHWAAQRYLPKALAGRVFYTPSECGYEAKIRDEVLRKRELQTAVILDEIATSGLADGEVLTYAAASRGTEAWLHRMESGRAGLLLRDRDRLYSALAVLRHHRVLVAAGDDGLLLWEALRRTPEGLAAATVRAEESRETLMRATAALDGAERPAIFAMPAGAGALPTPAVAREAFETDAFDSIVAREPWLRGFGEARAQEAFAAWATAAAALLPSGGRVALLQSVPSRGQRLSRFLAAEDRARLEAAEASFFADPSQVRLSWTPEELAAAFKDAGFAVDVADADDEEERRIGERELAAWFDAEKSSWGAHMRRALGDAEFVRLRAAVRELVEQGPLPWKRGAVLLRAEKTQ
jgi:putative ATPase